MVNNDIGTGCDEGGDEDDHDVAAITLADTVYDLALVKTLSSTTPGPFKIGNSVTFDITVTNQGDVVAKNIRVVDYIPTGLTLDDPLWAPTNTPGIVERYVPDSTISPGNSVNYRISFIINEDAGETIRNFAEISSDNGDDCDSIPDAINRNQP